MTEINPTNRKQFPPTLVQLFEANNQSLMKNINCVRVGIIKAFDPGAAGLRGANVDVLIAQQQVTSLADDGTQTLAEYPLLKAVPVVFPSGGGFTLTFPIALGDECLLLFHDREIDNWVITGAGTNGATPLPPSTSRFHDLSDAVAFVGLRSNPRAMSSSSTSATQLRSDDGGTYIEVGAGKIQLVADEVVIHGRNKTIFDAGGTGFKYTPNQIDTYTNGIPSYSNAPTPPEVT